MAVVLPFGKQQFTDAAGVSLALGSVAFYVPGTTTPKDTWQDAAQTVLNSNPVSLDIAGRAIIFGDGAYRQIVKDASGNTIWDQVVQSAVQDSLGTSTSIAPSQNAVQGFINSLLAGTGLALLGFIQNGVGAVLRNALIKMRESPPTPQDFGAVGDGVADDTAAFTAALTYLSQQVPVFNRNRDGQGVLFIPAGAYRITSSGVFSLATLVRRRGLQIMGAGRGNTILWLDCTDGNTKYFYDNASFPVSGTINKLWGPTFQSLTFCGGTDWHEDNGSGGTNGYSNLTNAKGFKISGPGWESAFHFIDVEWRYISDCIDCEGSNNADGHQLIGNNFNKTGRLFYINNPQSLSIGLTACYGELVWGNAIEYGPNASTGGSGGGGIFWDGGALIMDSTAGVDIYAFYAPQGFSAGNANATIADLHIELRGTKTHLYKNTTAGVCLLKFRENSILNTSGVAKEYGETSGTNTTIFDACSFKEQGDGTTIVTGYHTITGSTRVKRNAWLQFVQGCILQDDFHENGYVWNGGKGRLTVEKSGPIGATPGTQPQVIGFDCDVFGTTFNNFTSGRSQTLKNLSPFTTDSPLAAGQGARVAPGSTIRRVWVNLTPNGQTSASTFRIIVKNGDDSVTYGTSSAIAINVGGMYAVDIGIVAGTDLPSRGINVEFDNGSGGAPPAAVGLMLARGGVEYY